MKSDLFYRIEPGFPSKPRFTRNLSLYERGETSHQGNLNAKIIDIANAILDIRKSRYEFYTMRRESTEIQIRSKKNNPISSSHCKNKKGKISLRLRAKVQIHWTIPFEMQHTDVGKKDAL
jgi:hypothetical protein